MHNYNSLNKSLSHESICYSTACTYKSTYPTLADYCIWCMYLQFLRIESTTCCCTHYILEVNYRNMFLLDINLNIYCFHTEIHLCKLNNCSLLVLNMYRMMDDMISILNLLNNGYWDTL